jgi:hypothetical protein
MAGTTAAPYGFRVVKLAGNRPNALGNSLYPIVSNYGTSLYFGQPVVFASSGVQVASSTSLNSGADKYLGIFMGCTYTDPNLKYTVFKQYYPANTVASDIQAYVMDDPNAILQVQTNTTAFDVWANLSNNYIISSVGNGSATTGNSSIALDTNSASSDTNPFKVVGIAQNPLNVNAQTGNYIDVLVQVRAGVQIFNRSVQ